MENHDAVRLYMYEGRVFCKMLDVVKMIYHEIGETDNPSVLSVLHRMKQRIVRNNVLNTTEGGKNDNNLIPGRYAVAYPSGISYNYYTGDDNGAVRFTSDMKKAKLYVSFRDASAAADFIDNHDCCVLDLLNFMTEPERFRRALYVPYDADDGNEKAVVPGFVP